MTYKIHAWRERSYQVGNITDPKASSTVTTDRKVYQGDTDSLEWALSFTGMAFDEKKATRVLIVWSK